MSETHFGFERVREEEKARRVAGVFYSVADRYDLMNDLMSFGMHRLWKFFAVQVARVHAGERVLDVASGSGDLARAFAARGADVCMSDINGPMLARGRDRLVDAGCLVPAIRCDAEHLPFAEGLFDCVTVGFGLRNMTHKDRALGEMTRVLKKGGRLLVLEFSRISAALQKPYDLYSFKVLPWLGQRIAGDAAAYRYLAESIRMHPDQQALAQLMEHAGLERVEYFNLAGGAVAVHRGFKLG